MLQKAFTRYINNFRGFSREVWILAIITFINRAGTMVLPFLTTYMEDDLKFSLSRIGWVMACFGLGSMAGSWLGGKLADKIGFYKIMVFSLFTAGLLFWSLQFITRFHHLCIAMFITMVVADMFRPAMFVSLSTYAKPENRTRAFTLVRLAVNLGFAAGPAMAGLIIVGIGYRGLFWIDGASSIIAILIFALLVKEKKRPAPDPHAIIESKPKSALQDIPFLLFLFVSFATALVFFQLFSTIPLYHKKHYGLTEAHTGLMMSLNGFIIFLLEMPIVGYCERKHIRKIKIIIWGALCMALTFFVLLLDGWAGILIVSILFLTFGEMFCFPFSNAFAMSRAPRGQEGRYMALYTMTFSLAHILSAKTGMEIIGTNFNFALNWFVMGMIALASVVCLVLLQHLVNKENN